MTDYFVDDGGDNTDGQTRAKAFTTLAGAVAVATSASTIWVVKDHLETLGDTATWTFPEATGCRVVCVSTGNRDSGGTTADTLAEQTAVTEGWTHSVNKSISINGSVYLYGLSFMPGSGSSDTSASVFLGANGAVETGVVAEKCIFGTRGTHGNPTLYTGSSSDSHKSRLIDCTWRPGAASQEINIGGDTYMRNLTIDTTVATPQYLIKGPGSTGKFGVLLLENSDLSSLSAGILQQGADGVVKATLRNCQIPASTNVSNVSYDKFSNDSI